MPAKLIKSKYAEKCIDGTMAHKWNLLPNSGDATCMRCGKHRRFPTHNEVNEALYRQTAEGMAIMEDF